MNRKEHVVVLALFALLTAIFTYPAILNFLDAVPGGFDVFWDLWLLWWFKRALLELGTNPFVVPIIAHPVGANLYASTAMPLIALASIPLQLALGLYGAYNALFLLSFVLSGYMMYMLAKHVTGDARASFAAGLIFAFAPYRFAHYIHLNLLQTQWIPLYILLFLRMWEGRRWQDAALCGAVLALNFFTEVEYAIFLALFSALFAGREVLVGKRLQLLTVERRSVVLLSAFVFLVVSSPLLLPMAWESFMGGIVTGGFLGLAAAFSTDLLALLTPPPFHPIFGQFVASAYGEEGGLGRISLGNVAETVAFVGVGLLSLALYAVLRVKSAEARRWGDMTIAFALLSMGPLLKVGSVLLPVILPFLALFVLPGMANLRTPGRFMVVALVGLGLLAAIALKRLMVEARGRESALLYALVIVLIMFEFLAVPVQMMKPHELVDPFFFELANESGDFAVIYYGVDSLGQSEFAFYTQYLQTIHGRRTVNAQLSRTKGQSLEFRDVKAVKWIAYGALDEEVEEETVRDVLKGADVRYVVVFKVLLEGRQHLRDGLERVFGKPVYESGEIVVFRV